MKPRHSLRTRIVAAFAVFAVVASLCFSAFSLLFLYTVEDGFFDNLLRQEAGRQSAAWQAGGKPVAPLRPFVAVHKDPSTFAPDLARQFGAAPRQREFFGDAGRHYHVVRPEGTPLYLVAEVGAELVVRPRLPVIAGALGALAAALLGADGGLRLVAGAFGHRAAGTPCGTGVRRRSGPAAARLCQ